MRRILPVATIVSLAVINACTAKESVPAADTGMAAGQDTMATMAAGSDPDRATGGSGLPAGFVGRTDNPSAQITAAKYTASGGSWDIVTGPAHIVYRPQNVASGNYTASATIEQLEKPAHREAFGLIIGGKDLDQPTQAYTYFVVAGSGELLVKVREGDKTRDVLKWAASPDVPKADASGKASYALAAQVTGDAVKFMVNGKQVASVSKVGLPTDGIAGLRVNHNLHLKASPVTITPQ
ncbi:MAG: hypothetical protein M3O61_04425 [Gemmatimonadota bacterium]|nr:hypothetical protein [Gemmatimonadota bacterium]